MTGWPIKLRLYLGFVIAFGTAIACYEIWTAKIDIPFLQTWLILAALSLLCELFEVVLVRGHGFTAGLSVTIAAVLIGGPQLATFVVLTSTFFAEMWLRRKILSISITRYFTVVAFNVAQLVLSAVLAGALYFATSGHVILHWTFLDFLRALLTFVVYLIVNLLLVSGAVHFAEHIKFWPHFWTSLRLQVVQAVSLGFLAILIAIVHKLSPFYSMLTLIPLFFVQISLKEHVKFREQAKRAFEKITQIVSTRDPYTGVHSEEVAELAVKLARALKLPQQEVEKIEAAARVHDLGKIAIPDEILLKPGPLTAEEWKVVKKHPIVGAEILQGLEIYENCVDIIRHEHEHWDGTGYPAGLKGEEIPLGARIIAVADVWHALLSDRPYRKAYTKEEAKKIVRDMAGKVLDPKLVELFLKIVEE